MRERWPGSCHRYARGPGCEERTNFEDRSEGRRLRCSNRAAKRSLAFGPNLGQHHRRGRKCPAQRNRLLVLCVPETYAVPRHGSRHPLTRIPSRILSHTRRQLLAPPGGSPRLRYAPSLTQPNPIQPNLAQMIHGRTRVLPPPPSAAQGAGGEKLQRGKTRAGFAESKSLAKVERNDLQLEQILLLDQRTATVSVRLTDIEFLRLKERAGESGISVSAYMRSCILDADELRAQESSGRWPKCALSPGPNRISCLRPSLARAVTRRLAATGFVA